MPIITLTTDFGLKDPYVGAVKGAIYKELPQAQIVDISHLVSPFDISEAAYIIKNAYYSFPKGSIHIIGVDAEHTPINRHIAIYVDGHYFICADNGIMSLLMTKFKADKMVQINIHDRLPSHFTVLDAFVQTACHLGRGGTLEVIGKPIEQIKQIQNLVPTYTASSNTLSGHVIYIDNYGNAVTNIHKEDIEKYGKGRPFILNIRGERIQKIYNHYSGFIDFSKENATIEIDGVAVAIYNSAGHVEIATYKSNPKSVGSADKLFGIQVNRSITVIFKEP